MKRSHSRLSSKGFTLVETMVAMVIMTGAVIVVANAWSGNFMRVRNARVNNTIAALLERKMTEIEIFYRDKPVEDVKEEDGGDFGKLFPGYRWEMTSQPFEMPDMSGSLIAREGGADEMMLTVVRTTAEFIKQCVKEVSVSVYFKARAGQEIKHTVTTYLVDYSKELPLPGGGIPGGAASGGAPGGAAAPGGGTL